jgi:tRNA (guanine-N7-)-methyltransferase
MRSFGRVKGRPLKPRQAGLVETLLPHLAIEIPEAGKIDLRSLPPQAREGPGMGASLAPPAYDEARRFERAILEIGFGGGEHLVAQAQADPDALFLGAEPFLNGVGSCLRHIEESGATNVRLHHGDARDLLAALPDASLDRVYILFPDPWPKTRHWKRRLIQADFIGELARVLKPGGEVRFATDWKAYAAWTLELFVRDKRFAWTAERAEDWRAPWAGHVATRYEEKRLGDCAPIFLAFRRMGADNAVTQRYIPLNIADRSR